MLCGSNDAALRSWINQHVLDKGEFFCRQSFSYALIVSRFRRWTLNLMLNNYFGLLPLSYWVRLPLHRSRFILQHIDHYVLKPRPFHEEIAESLPTDPRMYLSLRWTCLTWLNSWNLKIELVNAIWHRHVTSSLIKRSTKRVLLKMIGCLNLYQQK